MLTKVSCLLCKNPIVFRIFKSDSTPFDQQRKRCWSFYVRPAWAHICGCESRCELVTVSKAKRNCVGVTESGKEAWSVNREPMNKHRIEGAAKLGEWA